MKYIHVDGDDGTLTVYKEIDHDWFGWVYEVPDDLVLTYTLEELTEGPAHFYETFERKGLKLVQSQ